jgi:hypothetical protein
MKAALFEDYIMNDLPTPKRFVASPLSFRGMAMFSITTDEDVINVLKLLAPVQKVETLINIKDQYRVLIDPRYAYDEPSAQQTYTWIVNELEKQFGTSTIPPKHKNED